MTLLYTYTTKMINRIHKAKRDITLEVGHNIKWN